MAWLMDPHDTGKVLMRSTINNSKHTLIAAEAYAGCIRKHITIHPTNPSRDVCQLKYLKVGLKMERKES